MMKNIDWNGEGLPPVGTEIEWFGGGWKKVLVVGHYLGSVIALDQSDPRNLYIGKKPIYRPFQTPEQIAAEERENAYKGMVDDLANAIGISNIDAREADVLHALADAGYRKMEKVNEK